MGLTPGDHTCWVYDDVRQFGALAEEFLAEGVERHERVAYIGPAPREELATQLTKLGDVNRLLAQGQLELFSSLDMYRDAAEIDPAAQVEVFRVKGLSALADGYTGFRAAADLTPLVDSPERLATFARYEHLVDRLMATARLTGLCGYDRSIIGEETARRIAALHPVAGGVEPGFHLFAFDDDAVGLAGELDVDSHPDFAWALRQLADLSGEVAVDASAVTFVDHRSLLELEAVAAECRLDLRLNGVSPVTRRVIDWLDLRRVSAAA